MDKRGSAVPLALLTLLILVSLGLALSALGTSEPGIATNHARSLQARAAAESGLHASLVALARPWEGPTSFATDLAGAVFVAMPGVHAGYRVALAVPPGATTAEAATRRAITVVGYAPSAAVSNHARRALTATAERDSIMATFSTPAALVAPSGATIAGEIDARAGPGTCGPGAPPAGVVTDPEHSVTVSGAVWGPGNDVPNEAGADLWHRGTAPPGRPQLEALAFVPSDLRALRALASANGTLFSGAPVPAQFGGDRTGAVAGASTLPDGLVYVEGDVEIEAYDATWTGWLVVVPAGDRTGTVTFTCLSSCDPSQRTLTMNGLVYAADALVVDTPAASRTVAVQGAVITLASSGRETRIAPRTPSDFRLNLDCQRVREAIAGTADTIGVGLTRRGWSLKRGTYREIAGP